MSTNGRTGAPAGNVQPSPNEKGALPLPPDTVLHIGSMTLPKSRVYRAVRFTS
jgi:hypothetical protein